MHTFHIYRYDPDADAKPRMRVIELEVGTDDRMLLDVLTRLKAIDPSLSFRRSCRERVCGSDAMKSPEARDELDGRYECIRSAYGSSACPSFW